MARQKVKVARSRACLNSLANAQRMCVFVTSDTIVVFASDFISYNLRFTDEASSTLTSMTYTLLAVTTIYCCKVGYSVYVSYITRHIGFVNRWCRIEAVTFVCVPMSVCLCVGSVSWFVYLSVFVSFHWTIIYLQTGTLQLNSTHGQVHMMTRGTLNND